MHDKLKKIIDLIQKSELDDTIKTILIRDLKAEGLTEFLRQQIIAYCIEDLKKHDPRIAEAERILKAGGDPNQVFNAAQTPA
jgi:hypothetical protein